MHWLDYLGWGLDNNGKGNTPTPVNSRGRNHDKALWSALVSGIYQSMPSSRLARVTSPFVTRFRIHIGNVSRTYGKTIGHVRLDALLFFFLQGFRRLVTYEHMCNFHSSVHLCDNYAPFFFTPMFPTPYSDASPLGFSFSYLSVHLWLGKASSYFLYIPRCIILSCRWLHH